MKLIKTLYDIFTGLLAFKEIFFDARDYERSHGSRRQAAWSNEKKKTTCSVLLDQLTKERLLVIIVDFLLGLLPALKER